MSVFTWKWSIKSDDYSPGDICSSIMVACGVLLVLRRCESDW
jgi:hypothetical protein